MMTPQVSRFVRDVLITGGHALPRTADNAAYERAVAVWEQTRDRIIDAGRVSPTVADLPQWLLDLAERLGVERP